MDKALRARFEKYLVLKKRIGREETLVQVTMRQRWLAIESNCRPLVAESGAIQVLHTRP